MRCIAVFIFRGIKKFEKPLKNKIMIRLSQPQSKRFKVRIK